MDLTHCVYAKLICDGYRACESLVASDICSSLQLDIVGDVDESVYFGDSLVTCVGTNACDDIETQVPVGTEENHLLDIHRHHCEG